MSESATHLSSPGPAAPETAGGGGTFPAAEDAVAVGRRVIGLEATALWQLEGRLSAAFGEAVELMLKSTGRVIVAGIGKSGIIGRKLAATLTSTGTPALFLHPVEGLHGDLGIVGRNDVALLVSKSGDSDELSQLVQYLSRLGVPILALTGRSNSMLARAATVVLDCSVEEEACPFDLAPTTSTTVALAMGDALAVALLLRRGFTREDFARLHPGGALGRKLTLRVQDVMLTEDYPFLAPTAPMRRCIVLLAEKRGTVPIVDEDMRVVGVVTAGDLTRLMEREDAIFDIPVATIMSRDPKLATPEELAAAAVHRMETHGIMALPVVAPDRRLLGIVHLHDLLRANAV